MYCAALSGEREPHCCGLYCLTALAGENVVGLYEKGETPELGGANCGAVGPNVVNKGLSSCRRLERASRRALMVGGVKFLTFVERAPQQHDAFTSHNNDM